MGTLLHGVVLIESHVGKIHFHKYFFSIHRRSKDPKIRNKHGIEK